MSKVIVSPKKTLIKKDLKTALERGVLFLVPLGVMYLTSVIGIVGKAVLDETFVLSLSYFIPGDLLVGAMILYVLNRGMDLLNRYTGKTVYKN